MKHSLWFALLLALNVHAAEPAGNHDPAAPVKDASGGPAAPAEADAFPCDLTKGANPTLRLIQLDTPKDEAVFQGMLQKAANGEVHFAFSNPRGGSIADFLKKEFPGADATKAGLFNLDDGFVQGLLESTAQYANTRRALKALNQHRAITALTRAERRAQKQTLVQISGALENVKLVAVDAIRGNLNYFNAWRGMDRTSFTKEAAALASAVDRVAAKRDDSLEWAVAFQELLKTPEWNSETGWLEVSRALAQSYGAMAMNDRATRSLPDLAPWKELMADPENSDREATFFGDVILQAGMKVQAKKVRDLYCQAKAAGKELHVAVYSPYFEPMALELQKASIGRTDADGVHFMKYRHQGHDFIVKNGEVIDVTPLPEEPEVIDITLPEDTKPLEVVPLMPTGKSVPVPAPAPPR